MNKKNIWGKKCICGNDTFAYFDDSVWNENNIKKEMVCEFCKKKISVTTIEAREFYKNLIYDCYKCVKGNVLELGCGGGILTSYLSTKKDIKNIIAIDNDMSFEEINYINSLNNTKFYKMNLNDFDEKTFNMHFDYVVCKDVLMYLDNIDYVFNKLSKISDNVILLNWHNDNHKNCLNKTKPIDVFKIIQKYYDNVEISYPSFHKWGYLIKSDMYKEKWALYDKNRNPLNKIIKRDSELKKGEFHLSVHAWIKNKDKFLIFQRDENKKIFPSFYEPIAGGVNEYEDSLECAIREIKEESGIIVSKEQLINKFYVVNDKCKYPEICDVYVFEVDFDIKDVKIEKGKNKNPRLLTKEEITKLIEKGEMIPLVIYKDKIKEL